MGDGKKLSSLDASFLYLETPEMPMHVGSMAIFRLPDGYKGDFFEEFKAMIASRLHIAPILKARLEKAPLDIDHPSWVEDDQFDIDRHIFRGSLPAPYDRATLERIVGWMHAKLLNRARPLWEFYVFEGMKDNEIGLYSKMHHACIDGGAGAALTSMIYDVTPVPREVEPPTARKVAQEPRDILFCNRKLGRWHPGHTIKRDMLLHQILQINAHVAFGCLSPLPIPAQSIEHDC